MTLSITHTRARQRWGILVAAVFALTLFGAAVSFAVHDEATFELEGNAVGGNTGFGVGSDPANPGSQPAGGDDWHLVYAGTSSAVATAFEADTTLSGGLAGAGDSILSGGGTKDINDLPSWLWKQTASTSTQDKADIEHAYAAQYVVDKTGEQCGSEPGTADCELLFFGADRFSNSGDTVMGFWFFRSNIGQLGPDAQGNGTFTGNHTARVEDAQGNITERGDILIVSDFRSGGKAPQIQIYEWVESGGSASEHLDLIAGGDNPASCTQAPGEKQNDPPVPAVGADDNFCATANQFVVTSPWPFDAKSNSGGTSGLGGSNTKFGVAEFMEGGLNLTALGFGDTCFSSFMAESRASHSVTSTLSDFVLGQFGACTSGITTTPQTGAGTAIGAAGISIGTTARVAVRDQAVIDVTGTTGPFGGTVKFFLCGPLALDSVSNCSSGGVQIGEPLAGETVSGSGGTATVNSDTATLTSAGRYCWRAEFSGDASVGVPLANDPVDTTNVSECFKVNPVAPTLTTAAGPDVTLGNPISDTASLTGTAMQPGTDGIGPGGTINATAPTQLAAGGSLTFDVRGPDDCDASGLSVTGSPVTVSGDNASYGPVTATPTALGTYTFVATYGGNLPNTLGAAGSCPDVSEEATVTGVSGISTAQDWLPNDTATLTGDANLNGTLTFVLYDDGTCGESGGSVVYTEPAITVTDAASGTTFPTTNETFVVEEADSGSYSWLVTYVDDNLDDPDPSCETTDIDIDDDPAP